MKILYNLKHIDIYITLQMELLSLLASLPNLELLGIGHVSLIS